MNDSREQRRTQERQRDQVVARAVRNRDETRRKLLAQGRELARRRAKNVERSRERGEDAAASTNPSVHSTVPPMDSNREATARPAYSTVPARPKGTTVPAAERLYGLRLYERIRADDAGTDEPQTGGSEPEENPTAATEGQR